jgi:hypothetical protein
MRTWWNGHAPVEGLAEQVLDAALTLEDSTTHILRDCGWT